MRDKTPKIRRKAVNLTIRADIIRDAKKFKINISQEAEGAISAAVKKSKEEEWLRENRKAIDAHNRRIRKHGLLIKSSWLKEEE